MTDQHPQNQPEPKGGQAWNEVSVEEIEQTLTSAADLAHELAGNVGTTPGQPTYRDTSGLESVETALDVELKQLEHLVSKTKEQLNEDSPPAPEGGVRAAVIPDFMSEFLSEEPVTVLPERRGSPETTEVETSGSFRSEGGPPSLEFGSERRGQPMDTPSKAGLVGVGSLGRHSTARPPRPEKSKAEKPEKPAHGRNWVKSLEAPLYRICDGGTQMLELMDRPFARLSPSTRRALSVTAIAAFCVCLLTFLLSLLLS